MLNRLIVLCLSVWISFSLTGAEVANTCHCDVTISFCDVGCCCDLDCTTIISNECTFRNSASFCPSTTYFARLSSNFITASGCFYYNTTTTIQEEISLTNINLLSLIPQPFLPVNTLQPYNGYPAFTALAFDGLSKFAVIQTDGTCSSTTAGIVPLSIYFGMNSQIRCKCTGSCPADSTQLMLFSSFINKTLAQYFGAATPTIKTPLINATAMTTLQLTFVIGEYGTQKVQYIQNVFGSYLTQTTTDRTLQIRFVQPREWKINKDLPTFFPQIPGDIFYPIYASASN